VWVGDADDDWRAIADRVVSVEVGVVVAAAGVVVIAAAVRVIAPTRIASADEERG
jgi:hypothetical protein